MAKQASPYRRGGCPAPPTCKTYVVAGHSCRSRLSRSLRSLCSLAALVPLPLRSPDRLVGAGSIGSADEPGRTASGSGSSLADFTRPCTPLTVLSVETYAGADSPAPCTPCEPQNQEGEGVLFRAVSRKTDLFSAGAGHPSHTSGKPMM